MEKTEVDLLITGMDVVAFDDAQYPNYDPMITLAEATVGPHVRTVVIDGRVVMKDRRILTIDPDAMRPRMTQHYRALMTRFERASA